MLSRKNHYLHPRDKSPLQKQSRLHPTNYPTKYTPLGDGNKSLRKLNNGNRHSLPCKILIDKASDQLVKRLPEDAKEIKFEVFDRHAAKSLHSGCFKDHKRHGRGEDLERHCSRGEA